MIDTIESFLICGFISWSMGVQLYDPMTEMCCQGEVHIFQASEGGLDTSLAFCCGATAYNLQHSICCSGQVLPRNHSAVSCCGADAYDITGNLCCGGAVVALEGSEGEELDEGGSGDIVTDGGDEAYGNNINTTLGDASLVGFYHVPMLCCGQEAYDWRREMCCADGVRPRPYPRAECCGGAAYDISRQVCCGATVHPEEGDVSLFCCGQQAYDSAAQQCCEGHLRAKPNTSVSYLCCGDQLMDPATQDCCGGAVVEAATTCCGREAFDTATQLCCDGVLHDAAAGKGLRCCGAATYGDGEVCCDGAVHALQASLPALPCCGAGLLVDAEQDMCCEGKVVRRRTAKTRCCGTATYESDQQLCCQGRALARGGASEACCGDQLYDADDQACCYEDGFQVLDKNGSRTSCCGRTPDGI